MKCYECSKRACTKIGSAEGSMLAAFLPKFLSKNLRLKTWVKKEKYLCRDCYERFKT